MKIKIILCGKPILVDKELFNNAMKQLKVYNLEEMEYDMAIWLDPNLNGSYKDIINRQNDKTLTETAEAILKDRLDFLND